MGQNHRRLAGALQRGKHVQEEGVVAVFLRRNAIAETVVLILCRVEAIAPGLGGERRVGDDKVEQLELTHRVFEMRRGQGVVLPDFRRGAVVQDHVHLGQGAGGVIHFLTVDGQVEAGGTLGFVVGFEQQRARTAGRVVDALLAVSSTCQADDLGHDPRHLGWGIELPLALAGLGGEMAHQVFVGITQDVVTLGAVAAEIEPWRVEDAH